MKRILSLFMIAIFSFTSCDTAGVLFGEPTEDEVIYALQKLLDSSALEALTTLKKVNQDGFGGLLPAEMQPVLETLQATGAIGDIDKVENKLKDVSATVLSESGSVLKESIQELKFTDAVAVVLGGEDAATEVLKGAMYRTLKNRYSDKLNAELNKVDPSLTNYWTLGSNAYNLLSRDKVDTELAGFLAERTVDMLFANMSKEEAEFRKNIPSLGNTTVSKVFDYYRSQRAIKERTGY